MVGVDRRGQPENPMVCPRDVRNIFCSRVPHVATGAVGIFRVMQYDELRLAMAGQALCPEKYRTLCWGRREVWIVTTRAGHSVSTYALARALSELFDLAYSTCGQIVAGIDIEGEIIGNRIAGMIVQRGMPSPFYRNISFEMTTDANRIAAIRIEMCRIHDSCFAIAVHMALGIPVASLACDDGMQKCQTAISVDVSRIALLHRTHVAAQATAFHRKRWRYLRHLCQARFHVIAVGPCVPRDRRLE